MSSYGFSFRASTRKGGGPGRLYLRVVHGGASRSVTTPYRILPEEWDSAGRRLVIPYGGSVRRRQLVEIESSMLCDLHRMDVVVGEIGRSGSYTADDLMDRYRTVTTGNTLEAFAEKLASEMESVGCRRTARIYRSAAARLRVFSGIVDLGFEHLTPELLADFQQSLKSEGRSMNTVSFYMRTLRAIYHKAISEGRIARRAESPFASVYTGIGVTRKLALTHDELALLSSFDPAEALSGYNTKTQTKTKTQTQTKTKTQTIPDSESLSSSDSLSRALAMFLFCYHARGMCFVDMVHLQKSDIKGGVIRYRRVKTGQSIEVRVLPAMQRIIDWFAPYTSGSKYVFPVIVDPDKDISLQYESGLRLQNKRLKKIASLCGISKKLSTHVARHSWATVAKSAGLPLAVISEGLGHTNQRTTEIYLASLERSVIDRAALVVSRAISPPGSSPRSGRRSGGVLPFSLPSGLAFGAFGSTAGMFRG